MSAPTDLAAIRRAFDTTIAGPSIPELTEAGERLRIIETCGWFEWEVVNARGDLLGRSGPQNLRSNQQALDHYAATRGARLRATGAAA